MAAAKSVIDVEILLPAVLENSEEEILNHKFLATQTLKYLHDQYDSFVAHCEKILALDGSYRSHPTECTHYETQLKKLKRECDADENKIFKLEQTITSLENESKSLRSQNEKIQDEILQLSEDTERLALRAEQLTKQRKECTESMDLMWRTYVAAKNLYKRNLMCHIRLHEPADKIQEASDQGDTLTFSYLKDADTKPVLEVKLNINNDTWKMLDVQPFILAAVEAGRNLDETNDIRDFLCCLRKEAVKLSKP